MTETEIKAAVDRGSELDRDIKAKSEELKKIKAQLTALQPGEYVGDSGRVAKVIQPKSAVKPPPERIDIIREQIGDESFKQLFLRVVTWSPVREIRAVAERVLDKQSLRKFLGLAEVPGQPYVIFQ